MKMKNEVGYKLKTILVTGGAGYIGSQTVKELAQAGYFPVVYDNLSTGHREAVLFGDFVLGDLSDEAKLSQTFQEYKPEAVIHFAASVEVEESVRNPQKYFINNFSNGINLLKVMLKQNVRKIIFSSTAAVYGNPKRVPIKEVDNTSPINPYGLSKLMFEEVLSWYDKAYGLKSVCFRYFNAAGADPSGKIGQDSPKPTHLITRAILTALGKYPYLEIYGTDYPTKDGTCIRDYIHVKDLSIAHILGLGFLQEGNSSKIYNLGTGRGYSVKEVIAMVKRVTGVDFKVKEASRRPGDPAELVASSQKAQKELNFLPKFSNLETIIETAWNWHRLHPSGFSR